MTATATLRRGVARAATPAARWYVRHAPVRAGTGAVAVRLVEGGLRTWPRSFTTRTRPGFVLQGSTDQMIERYVYAFGVWEPNLTAWLERTVRSRRTVVDVGANVGYVSLLASRLVGPHGQVVAVEPSPEVLPRLRANLRANDADNVRVAAMAATDRPRVLRLVPGERGNSGTTAVADTDADAGAGADGDGGAVEIEGRPLAALLTDEEVATLQVVKIDVEGAELDVLRGLAPVLDAVSDDACIVCEVDPQRLAARGSTVDELFTLLGQHGFSPYGLPNDYAPRAYAERRPPVPPRRLTGVPARSVDVVFARSTADEL